jgi:hypothetical protein
VALLSPFWPGLPAGTWEREQKKARRGFDHRRAVELGCDVSYVTRQESRPDGHMAMRLYVRLRVAVIVNILDKYTDRAGTRQAKPVRRSRESGFRRADEPPFLIPNS